MKCIRLENLTSSSW